MAYCECCSPLRQERWQRTMSGLVLPKSSRGFFRHRWLLTTPLGYRTRPYLGWTWTQAPPSMGSEQMPMTALASMIDTLCDRADDRVNES